MTILKWVHHVGFIFLFACFSMCPASQQAGKGFTDHTVFNSRTSISAQLIKDARPPLHALCAVIPPHLLTCLSDAASTTSAVVLFAALFPPGGAAALLDTTRLLL